MAHHVTWGAVTLSMPGLTSGLRFQGPAAMAGCRAFVLTVHALPEVTGMPAAQSHSLDLVHERSVLSPQQWPPVGPGMSARGGPAHKPCRHRHALLHTPDKPRRNTPDLCTAAPAVHTFCCRWWTCSHAPAPKLSWNWRTSWDGSSLTSTAQRRAAAALGHHV